MFALSSRFGALADRYGPRLFMGAGPLIAAAGILLLLRTGLDTSYVTDVLPAVLVFSLGLTMTVAPLTAAVLADADETDAGIASAVNMPSPASRGSWESRLRGSSLRACSSETPSSPTTPRSTPSTGWSS